MNDNKIILRSAAVRHRMRYHGENGKKLDAPWLTGSCHVPVQVRSDVPPPRRSAISELGPIPHSGCRCASVVMLASAASYGYNTAGMSVD